MKFEVIHFNASLPSPDGPLSKAITSEGILLADKEVKEVLEGDGMVPLNGNMSGNHTRGPYEHFTPDEKATVGKKAAEIGVAATVKSFSKRREVGFGNMMSTNN